MSRVEQEFSYLTLFIFYSCYFFFKFELFHYQLSVIKSLSGVDQVPVKGDCQVVSSSTTLTYQIVITTTVDFKCQERDWRVLTSLRARETDSSQSAGGTD